jgi:hypothetical protein
LDKICAKKAKCFVVSGPMIKKSNLSIQQYILSILKSALLVFHIEALSDSLLYIEFVVVFFMPILTTTQLYIDKLLFILMASTLLSLVVVVVTANLM